jgi:hypothetical protein
MNVICVVELRRLHRTGLRARDPRAGPVLPDRRGTMLGRDCCKNVTSAPVVIVDPARARVVLRRATWTLVRHSDDRTGHGLA